MSKKEFKFLEAYRMAAPAAQREVIDARQKAHEALFALITNMGKVYDLCRIAFGLPFNQVMVSEWFEKTVKGPDIHFSLEIDKAEAARLATLLLRDLAWRGPVHYSLATLVASYCGKREPVGGGDLLAEAAAAVAAAGNERRVVFPNSKIAMPAAKDLKAEIEAAASSNFQGGTGRAALEAVAADLRSGATEVANAANNAFASMRSDAIRLAEEVDMLWWYMGDWSELLKKPRTALGEPQTAVATAVELGDLVRSIPGPYGAYGILRRSLGSAVDKRTSLKAALEAIDAEDLVGLVKPLPASVHAVFPVQAAINIAVERGTKDSAAALESSLGRVPAIDISLYELAVQTFRERMMIGFGGLGQ